ncbi:hypothetical protein FisN_3Lh566 [Fistulifera solaris]|uniref:Uncharacterized protein n=1 Tax=Fistulifera solaris TaxID=1519565 RepID=A0A1Z5J8S4_FISSO|nr:hypothetical protein FisN_3Lh566 [Fistulifera solaris]|eukprot:GAX10356.1 hypothetical protein FisN_3Lh566 [Fistulifera solaris]
MVAPTMGQPVILAHGKAPASRSPRRERRDLRKMKGKVAASLKRSSNKHDGRILSALLAVPPPPPPPPPPPQPTNVLKTTNKIQSTLSQPVSRMAKTTPPNIHRHPLESYDSWDQLKHQTSLPSVVATRSDDLTVSTIASPRQGILSERLRTTRAIHYTDTLVLDAVPENDPSVAVRKKHDLSIKSAPSSVTATTVTIASGSATSRRSPTESENSDSTKMIGNPSSYEKDGSVTPPTRRLKTRTPERVQSTEKEKRPKTPKRLRRLALRPKKTAVAKSVPKKTTFERSMTAPLEIMKKDVDDKANHDETASSKGFFSKLFLTGRKKKKTIVVLSSSDESTLQTETRSETTAPVNQSNSEDVGEGNENTRVDTLTSKGGNGLSPKRNGDNLHRGRTIRYHGHDEVSTLSAPTFNSLGRRSLDPDSRESIRSQRVHEPTGLYLQAHEKLDIDTVASYAGSTSDPPEKDDSSTTANTRRTSIDPTDDTPRLRGSEPRESHLRTSHSFRDPSPRHLLRDPSPTDNTKRPSFDFDIASSREKLLSVSEIQESSRGSPLNYLRMQASLKSFAPDPPLNSVELIDVEPENEKLASFRRAQNNRLPPPPPPPRQSVSCRSVVIQLPSSKDENVPLLSPHHHTVNGSPPGILRTVSTNLWTGTDPIDSDVILAREYGVSDQKRTDSTHVIKESKSKHFSIMKAARFSTQTNSNQIKEDSTASQRRSCDQDRESHDDGLRTHIAKVGNNIPRFMKTGTPKAPPVNSVSHTTFIARNKKFKNRTRILKQKSANAVSKGGCSGPRKLTPFSIGASILRRRREEGIASGKFRRVEPKTKGLAVESKNKPVETIDPIHRAGIRVLSKSAVPIQNAARRFLAQREAIDRMWGILEIQCYMRRWKAEAALLAYQSSARTIQRVFRGAQVRKKLEVNHMAAIEIQKVIRGYLACVSTFDTVFRIIVAQSAARGFLVRTRMHRFEEKCRELAATKVQQWWRCMSCQRQYQFFIVDVLILQSAFRSWKAQREYRTIMNFRRTEAARCIQAAWRGFQCYTDYIFSLVDVVNVQRTARRWLAIRKVEQMRRDKAAMVIQSQIRKYSAQYKLLLSLMNAILIQSTTRMFLAKKLLNRKRVDYQRRQTAAAKIQAAWRGFSMFTDYVFMQYRIVKFQSLFRGFMVRRQARFRLGSIVIIQSHVRKYLAQEKTRSLQVDRIFTYGQSSGIRETWAANRIQFWWRVVLDCRKEKHAALVIERFFLMVKREVDMEIARVQRRFMKKRRGKQEKLILDTVEGAISEPTRIKAGIFLAAPTSPKGQALHRVKKSASIVSSDSLNFTYSADDSEVSGPSYFAQRPTSQQTAPRTAAEKYASMYGICTKKSTESKQKNYYLGETIENSLSSGSSIHGIQFTTSPGSTVGALSPLGSPSRTMAKRSIGTKAVKHFDFDVKSDDEFGLI